jgi:ATP-binding cassette subfamily C protein
MLHSIEKLWWILGPRAQRNSLILFAFMLVGGLLEVVGVAVVPAFIGLFLNPERLSEYDPTGGIADYVASLDQMSLVIAGSILLAAVFAAKTLFLIVNAYLQVRFVTRRRVDFVSRLSRAYMRAPYTFHLQRNTSELLRNVDREAMMVSYQVLGPVLDVCTKSVILVAVLIFLFFVEPWITLYWFGLLGITAVAGFGFFSGRLKRYGRWEQRQRKEFVQALYQGMGSMKEARVLNREHFFEQRMEASVRAQAVATRLKMLMSKLVAPLTEFVGVVGLLGLLLVLFLLDRPSDQIIVTLSLFVIGLVRLRQALNAMLQHLTNLRYNLVSVDPVYDDLRLLGDERREAPAKPDGRPFLRDRIAFHDVSYSYEGDQRRYSLRNVSLEIPAGAAVAFVGPTGAGKSTLVDTLLGLLEPDEGCITVDGVTLDRSNMSRWQTRIGYVPQSIYLLDDTIRRNVALGLPDADIDEAKVRAAARKAQLDEFLERQPQGLDTIIGERGNRISGGERQRIGIARALYHDPEVLILDEATSSLDNETERAVVEAVEAEKGQRTIIMIAHRLSTVRNCSILFYMKDGRVEESGSFAELQHRSSDFRTLAAGAGYRASA